MIYILLIIVLLSFYGAYTILRLVHHESVIGSLRRELLVSGGNIFLDLYHDPNVSNDALYPLAESLANNDVDTVMFNLQQLDEEYVIDSFDKEKMLTTRELLEKSKEPLVSIINLAPNQHIASYCDIQPERWERKKYGNPKT